MIRVEVGQRFERLLVIGLIKDKKNPKAQCICDCGQIVAPQRGALVNGRAKSCGCLKKELLAKHVESIKLTDKERKIRRNKCLKSWIERNKSRHREINNKATRKFYSLNPLKAKENCRKRRASLCNAAGQVSKNIDLILMELQKGLCACCKISLISTGHHLDHILPISRGGMHEDSNIQLLCPPCNLSKGAKMPEQFMKERGFLL